MQLGRTVWQNFVTSDHGIMSVMVMFFPALSREVTWAAENEGFTCGHYLM